MADSKRCQSCGMPIEAGAYCRHCVDESGRLQSFEVRVERMVQWMLSNDPALGQAEAESRARAHMRQMPAWKDDPHLAE